MEQKDLTKLNITHKNLQQTRNRKELTQLDKSIYTKSIANVLLNGGNLNVAPMVRNESRMSTPITSIQLCKEALVTARRREKQ